MLETLLILWLLPAAFSIVYLLLLARFGLRLPRACPALPFRTSGEDSEWRFNIVVPAHNEEAAIGVLLDSLQALDYPAEQLRLLVVADHCDDDTVALVRGRGVAVIDRQSGPRGKQAALADGVQQLLPQMGERDALVVFDADNIVDRRFLIEAKRLLDAGYPVVQGNTGIHNRDASIFTRLNHVNFAVTNRFKELARSQAGLTCRLRGHGMLFRTDVVRTLDWQATSLVEDAETLLKLVLSGQRVVWAHRAHVNSVIPATAASATAQRKRWAGGKSELTKHAVRHLLKKALTGDRVAFDLMIDYLMLSNAMLLGMIMVGLLSSLALFGPEHALSLAYAALGLAFLGYFSLGCRLERVPLGSFFTFLFSPLFVLWRMWVQLASLGGAKSWH